MTRKREETVVELATLRDYVEQALELMGGPPAVVLRNRLNEWYATGTGGTILNPSPDRRKRSVITQ